MRCKHVVAFFVLLALALTPAPAHAAGVVSVCDEAHLKAALAGGGTVTVTCSGRITLTSTITITDNTTIEGNGQNITNCNSEMRLLAVKAGTTLYLNNLVLSNGIAVICEGHGGGIFNEGALYVSNSSFTNNWGEGGLGGGIHNEGTLTVSNSYFDQNRGHGGGIYNNGVANVAKGWFDQNNDPDSSGAGGIQNDGIMTVSNSLFSANNSSTGAGGIQNNGMLTVSNCYFSSNSAPQAGAIYNNGTLTVSNSAFDINWSYSSGGGIRNYGTAILTNSTLADNSGNLDHTAVSNSGTLTVTNSTFSANRILYGGGINNDQNGTVTLKNSIVAIGVGGGHCSGTIIDGGGNLSYPDTTCPGINSDPKLGPLQNNGGPTPTMALLPGSAAIDAANDATCAAAPVSNRDQRGYPRPVGTHCDIGVYEVFQPTDYVYLSIIRR